MKFQLPSRWSQLNSANQAGIPAYFNLVMATGIVSIAAHLLGFERIAGWMFYMNILFYGFLMVLFARKLIFSFNQVLKELRFYRTGPAYFTLIAATSILGSQLYWMEGDGTAIGVFLIIAFILWALISYSFFALITVSTDNPGIGRGLDGSWLVSVVATQSIPILGSYVVGHLSAGSQEVLLFVYTAFFFIGCILYIILITLIFYRLVFIPLGASELDAPYWINMGAVAITTLAGSSLIGQIDHGPLSDILPFVKGLTIFFWSIGTWWIPLLVILGVWRHFYHAVPLPWSYRGYRLSYWSMVFPLGMYTVCTYEMAAVLELPFLEFIPHYFIYVAFGGWLITFAGLLDANYRKLFRK